MQSLKAKIYVLCPKTKREVNIKNECASCQEIECAELKGQTRFFMVCHKQRALMKVMVECPKDKTEVSAGVTCEQCKSLKHVWLEGQLGLYIICMYPDEKARGNT